MIRVAQAGSNEWRGIYGGEAGDQRKTKTDANGCFEGELSIVKWYSKPWDYLLRCNDPSKAEIIATAMERLCNNVNIGYDQNQNETLWDECERIGWDINRINEIRPCECDCCRLYDVALRFAGINVTGQKHWYTGSVRPGVISTGFFTVYNDPAYLTATDNLKRGDALLKEGSHIVTVLDSAEVKSDPYRSTGNVWMRTGPGTDYSKIKAIPNDQIVNVFRKLNGWVYAEHDGNIGYVSLKYLSPITTLTTTGNVWQRKSAGITGTQIQAIPSGKTVYGTGRTTKVILTTWYEVTYNGKTGWCSGKYLK